MSAYINGARGGVARRAGHGESADVMTKVFSAVLAATAEGGIGLAQTLPWHLPKDMAFFSQLTSRGVNPNNAVRKDAINAVIMGRRTWDSTPIAYRPLPGRINVIVSRQMYGSATVNSEDGTRRHSSAYVVQTLDEALSLTLEQLGVEAFVIGGAGLYAEAFAHPQCRYIFYTQVFTPVECDVFAPGLDVLARTYKRQPHQELQKWLPLMKCKGEQMPVPEGVQEEKGMTYEFQLWEKTS